jgi:hypothetical protein
LFPFPYFHAGGKALFMQKCVSLYHLRTEPGAFHIHPQFSALTDDFIESLIDSDIVLPFVYERPHGVGDMDFIGENDEAFQRAPPLYHSLLKSVPGEYPVGVSQDEAVGRQVTAYCQQSVRIAVVRIGKCNFVS